tara:strand:- start:1059 stop:1715 length:657 start_codon:yes stop_codon:yes gene_type:complete
MIDTKDLIRNFKGKSPLFTISNFVMYPKTVYSFNIFEEKYKKMISDVLKNDKLFTINLIEGKKSYDIATLCYILESQKLDNGNYNIIVSGIRKVKIKNKIEDGIYKSADLNIVEENTTIIEEHLKRKKLINKFLSLVSGDINDINLKMIDTSLISTEMLVNLGCLILPLENIDKQKLLELNDIELRLQVLCQFMDSELKIESDLLNFNQIIPANINWN